MSKRSTWRNLAAIAVLATAVSAAHAADTNGRIKGTVTDPSGAVVANAIVTATNQATGVKSTVKSSSKGDYNFSQLPVGTYTISTSADGFKSFSATGITINIDQEYVEPIILTLGASSETISVAADAVQVNTTDMQLNNVVTGMQLQELPNLGRNFTSLELIEPGVQAPSDRFTGNYSVNGGESQQSSYLINGADTNDFALNTIGIEPNEDALDQFNLITGPLNAEYSRNSGAIVSAVVKGGTNQIHGDLFEFYRDTFLNTAGFYNYKSVANADGTFTNSKPTPLFHQNIFGATIGFPIIKDKLFFFGAYQGARSKTPQSAGTSTPVPSANQRTGNFGGSTFSGNIIPGQLNIPGCVSGVDTFAACFGPTRLNGVLPTMAIDPIANKLLQQFVPQANVGTKYTFNPTTSSIQDQGILRVDYTPSQKDRIAFIGIYQHAPRLDVLPFTGPNLPGFGDQNTSEIRQFTGQYTRQITSSAVNELDLHYSRFNLGAVAPQNVVQPSTLGFGITPQDAAGATYPLINLTGGFSIGFSTNGPQPRVDQNYQVDDSFTKVIGNHTIKVGFDGRKFTVDNEFDGTNSGAFGFTAASSNRNSSGNVYLDFLLGNPSSYSQGGNGRIDAKSFEYYGYAQDTWKITSNLTLSFGVGYQVDTAIHNRQFGGEGVNCFISGQQSKIFPTAPLSLNYPGDPGCNDAQGAITPYGDVGPRFGFAYSPELGFLSGGNSHKLSVRGGYGIYYNRTEEEGSLQNLSQVPFGISSAGIRDVYSGVKDKPTFANPYKDINTGVTITNPFPVAFPKPGATNIAFTNNPLYLSGYAPGYKVPYAENFQLSIERELPGQSVLTMSYVGSVGRHNQDTIEGNPVTAAGHAACLADLNCQSNRDDQEILYPTHTLHPQAINPLTGATHFYSASQIETEASSNFNALEVSLKKGITHGLQAQISYTYSHALDSTSSYEGAGFGGERGYNQYQASTNYGNADFDARHRLVIAPIYVVPFRAGSNAFSLRNIAGAGWQISAITTFATGHPYDFSYQGGESYSLYCSANDFYYTCPDVPNQVAPVKFHNPHDTRQATKGQFFDNGIGGPTDSFTDEAIGTFGNISRNKYHGPGIDNTDVVIAKNFDLGHDGTRRLQLRLTTANVFNHTDFANPNGNPDTGPGTFGVISSTNSSLPARQTQLAAKIYF